MKIFNGIFAFLFALSAVLQYNDPDPVLWILIYSYLTLVCILAILGKIRKYYLIVGTILLSVYAILLFPGVIDWFNSGSQETILQGMDRKKPYLEETREFFGLIIGLGVILINWIKR